MAQLYRAKIIGVEGFEKFIAIKQILPHLANEEEAITSFIDEAKLAALLNHQNVVQIYDFGSMENSYFITMEYLFGRTCARSTRKRGEGNPGQPRKRPVPDLQGVRRARLRAQAGRTSRGNPEHHPSGHLSQNVFLTYEGDVKIVDFGIAKAASQSTITQVGMIKGKVAYMSPEQAAGKVIDHRSDIFATGILLYELVAGGRMFKGRRYPQILSKVREAEFTPLGTLKGGLPGEVVRHRRQGPRQGPRRPVPVVGRHAGGYRGVHFPAQPASFRPQHGRVPESSLRRGDRGGRERMADAAGAGAASDRAQEAESSLRSVDKPPAQKPPAPKAEPAPPAKAAPKVRPKPAEPARVGRKAPWPPSRALRRWLFSVEDIT